MVKANVYDMVTNRILQNWKKVKSHGRNHGQVYDQEHITNHQKTLQPFKSDAFTAYRRICNL